MFERVKQMLDMEYGIQLQSMYEMPAGWSASGWKIHALEKHYFLKVYEKQKYSTINWILRIDQYMPVVLWLYENTQLRSQMVTPLLAIDGSYKKEDSDYLYMVFPFLDGETICDQRLNSDQIGEIAKIISDLHLYNMEIPVKTRQLIETYNISFCETLQNRLQKLEHLVTLKEMLAPYLTMLFQKIRTLQEMAVMLRESDLPFVLCHTDLHGWNLIQSEKLILIDWEGLKLAPAEADLFFFSETFFFDYAWTEFMEVYCNVHKDYQVNPGAMRFYRLRRRLEDIHEIVESILFDDLSQSEENKWLASLKRECELLQII